MSDNRVVQSGGMSAGAARRLEYTLIAIGIFALALIFQPFSLGLFGLGCGLVVFAGLVNNLLPFCRPGVAPVYVLRVALIVAFIFSIALLISIAAAHLYGVFFVVAFAPDTSTPFYEQPFVWGIAAIAVVLAAALRWLKAPTSA